jgi:hypothetical protein
MPTYNVYYSFSVGTVPGISKYTFYGVREPNEAGAQGNSIFVGRTNYLPVRGTFDVSGDAFYDRYAGLFLNRRRVKLSDATDGLTNTMAVGEGLGTITSGTIRDRLWSWMGCAMVMYWGIDETANSWWYNFSSKHPGTALFAFGDGSVRGVRKGVSGNALQFDTHWYHMQELAGKADGYADDTSDVMIP